VYLLVVHLVQQRVIIYPLRLALPEIINIRTPTYSSMRMLSIYIHTYSEILMKLSLMHLKEC